MDEEEETKEKERRHLADCMNTIIRQLGTDKKNPAVHTYRSTLNSFRKFSGGAEAEMPIDEVFKPGKLKEYETWLRQKGLKWNSVSTYMRTLKAVYNRLYLPGSAEHDPGLFDDVYTKVESQTKRALDKEQMQTLLDAASAGLPEDVQCVLVYFLLMFLFRGMPFIDLCYLRKQDLQGNCIVYCRHKTGRQIVVRIPREAQQWFERYRNKKAGSTYLFPILSEAAKEDEEVYACYRQALRRFNRQLKKMASLSMPGVKISSYTARHTWATLAYHQGINTGVISQALGHSSIKVTETYLKPFKDEMVDAANEELIVSVMKSKKDNNAA